ncbi:MAG: RNA polymerase factor sigma-54 [unclassified Hahellaceae]|nr:RNA polymerase factor sigma-54 [Hahellaceae bacterium]|tara:strand:- start:56141 stop:57679 length:1539 start_codon:yes stop_codon:yes gene_type:complete
MVMKTSLQLKMGQHLTMTPQLQQAIKLLQLSTLDLQQEIQQALDSNPMLELEEDDHDRGPERLESDRNAERDSEIRSDASETMEATERQDSLDTIPEDLPVDTAWEDVYQSNTSSSSGSGSGGDDDFDFESRNSRAESLQDHLLWQLNLCPMSDTDRLIAHSIVDAVNDDGYLTQTLAEIHEGLVDMQQRMADREEIALGDDEVIELDEVQAVLKRIQQFDPPGVAARDLQECLLIQLLQLPPSTPWLNQAKLVISHYINLLGSRDYAQLMRRSRIKESDLKEVMRLIQSLNPRPGEGVQTTDTEYVVPDVIVKKLKDRWTVELNPEIAPRIRVNSTYAGMVKRADSSADNTYLKDQLQEAKWFLKSLQSRNETLLKVATKIVEHQQGFLDYGEEAMKPLVLHDIAEAVEMHESTISRVTTQKYMHTPRGVFELKYFFSSHVGTESGGECSSTAIRAIIKKLVAAESPKKPLSDSKIASILADQGINVARRTIAKYREAMSIPPSNERKRLI